MFTKIIAKLRDLLNQKERRKNKYTRQYQRRGNVYTPSQKKKRRLA